MNGCYFSFIYFQTFEMVGQDKAFNSSDLLKYVESIMREVGQLQWKCVVQNNYGWLRSRHLQNEHQAEEGLEELKPRVQKLSPESCTSIAVKLEVLTEHIASTTLILPILKNLLDEEDSMIAMAGNIQRGKETKTTNKVFPMLAGRQATVSFVCQNDTN